MKKNLILKIATVAFAALSFPALNGTNLTTQAMNENINQEPIKPTHEQLEKVNEKLKLKVESPTYLGGYHDVYDQASKLENLINTKNFVDIFQTINRRYDGLPYNIYDEEYYKGKSFKNLNDDVLKPIKNFLASVLATGYERYFDLCNGKLYGVSSIFSLTGNAKEAIRKILVKYGDLMKNGELEYYDFAKTCYKIGNNWYPLEPTKGYKYKMNKMIDWNNERAERGEISHYSGLEPVTVKPIEKLTTEYYENNNSNEDIREFFDNLYDVYVLANDISNYNNVLY